MRLLISVLMLPFLVGLSSCCSPEVRYVDKVVYKKPVVPNPPTTEYPSVRLNVWGDYAVFKAQCVAQIDKCNADKKSIIDSLDTGEADE